MNKILSIAMPCYNVEKYLNRGLSSLADNRLADSVEVLIVNDGSQDSTEDIALKYVKQYPSIFRLINKKNGGHGSAVNAGLKNASGEYFRVIDGDDWVNTEGLVALVEHLKQSPSDIVVDELSHVDMSTMKAVHQPLPSYVEEDKVLAFASVCNTSDLESYMAIHTLTFRTSLLKNNNVELREGIFYVDYEYIVKGTCFAETVTFYRINVYQYLIGNAAQSMAYPNMVKRYLHHEAVLRELLGFEATNSENFSQEIRDYLQNKIRLLIHTHYNVILIYDQDRKRGTRRGKEFDSWLKGEHPRYFALTSHRRKQAWILHHLGFNADKLNALMGR